MDYFNLMDISMENDSVFGHVLFFKDHPIFQQHFPNRPILPGAMIIDFFYFVISNNQISRTVCIESIERAKFIKQIVPDTVYYFCSSLSKKIIRKNISSIAVHFFLADKNVSANKLVQGDLILI